VPLVQVSSVLFSGPGYCLNHLGMYATTYINSAFYPCEVGKSSTGLSGVMRGVFSVHLYQVAGNTPI